jgi:hypothetical protein
MGHFVKILALLQKAFVVSVSNTCMVSVRGTDTICTIQKINHLLYRLEQTNMKNQFSKIKRNIVLPPPRSASRIRRRDEAAAPRSGGGRRRRSASWSPRWGRRASVGAARPCGHRGGEGGRQWEPLVVVVTEVGKEGVGGRRSSSWLPRWGRWASVGATRPRGCRGGEGGRRWESLVLVVTKVGKEGVGGPPPTTSASPCHRLPPPPHQAQRPSCRRLPRRLSPRQNQRKERRERTE